MLLRTPLYDAAFFPTENINASLMNADSPRTIELKFCDDSVHACVHARLAKHTPLHTPKHTPLHTPKHTPLHTPKHTPLHTPVGSVLKVQRDTCPYILARAYSPLHTPGCRKCVGACVSGQGEG